MLQEDARIWRLRKDRGFHSYDQPGEPFLNYGNDGYDMVFKRLEETEER